MKKRPFFKYPPKNSCLATRTSTLSMRFLRAKEGGKEKTCENSFSLLPMVPCASSPVICVTLASSARLCAKKEAPEVEAVRHGTRCPSTRQAPGPCVLEFNPVQSTKSRGKVLGQTLHSTRYSVLTSWRMSKGMFSWKGVRQWVTSLRRRLNLTSVRNVCEAVPKSLFLAP